MLYADDSAVVSGARHRAADGGAAPRPRARTRTRPPELLLAERIASGAVRRAEPAVDARRAAALHGAQVGLLARAPGVRALRERPRGHVAGGAQGVPAVRDRLLESAARRPRVAAPASDSRAKGGRE